MVWYINNQRDQRTTTETCTCSSRTLAKYVSEYVFTGISSHGSSRDCVSVPGHERIRMYFGGEEYGLTRSTRLAHDISESCIAISIRVRLRNFYLFRAYITTSFVITPYCRSRVLPWKIPFVWYFSVNGRRYENGNVIRFYVAAFRFYIPSRLLEDLFHFCFETRTRVRRRSSAKSFEHRCEQTNGTGEVWLNNPHGNWNGVQ